MPYVGNPLADAFSSREKQDLTGQSGTSFTLTHAVSHANDLSVYINHVRQEPTTAYSVNGTTLTTTGSVAGTDDFYIIYDELAVQSISHPTDQALTATSGTFTSGLVGTTATFSGAVSGTTGTFSGALSAKGGAVFNEDSADVDFRVESDNDANAFFVQGSDGKIGMGISTPRNNLDFGVTSNNDHIIALRDNNTSRTILGLTNGYGVRVGAPSDGTNTENMFEVGQINSSDGTTYQNTKFAVAYNGNIGIGRTTVTESGFNTLVIGGALSTTGSKMQFYDSAGNYDGQIYAQASGIFMQGSTDARIFGSGTKGMRVESDGQCTISRGDEGAGNNSAALTLSYSLGNNWGGFQMYTYSYYSDVNFRIQNNDTNGGRNHNDMAFIRSGATRGSISIHTGSTSFNTTSDYRMKKDEKPITNAIDTVKKLKPYNFNWKDSGINEDGIFAHEVDEVLDYVVTGKKDAVKTYENVVLNKDGFMVDSDVTKEQYEKRIDDKDNEDGSPIGETTYPEGSTWKETHEDVEAQQMDSSKLVPILTAALQEAIKRIEVLESK